MNGYKAGIKAALNMVYVFGVLLAGAAVALPFIVTWYVETRGRDQTLPATIMLTCYPCVPFAAAILISLKRLLKNVLDGLVLGDKNLSLLQAVAISFFAITAITLAAGRYYKPFYILAACAAACGLTFFVVRSLFNTLLQKQRENDFKSIEENL